MFPHRMQTVALWGFTTNWGYFQASAHVDVYNSFQNRAVPWKIDIEQSVSIFDYYLNFQRMSYFRTVLGAVLE